MFAIGPKAGRRPGASTMIDLSNLSPYCTAA